MSDKVFDAFFEGFNEFDDDIMLENAFDGLFEGADGSDADITLDAACTNATVA